VVGGVPEAQTQSDRSMMAPWRILAVGGLGGSFGYLDGLGRCELDQPCLGRIG